MKVVTHSTNAGIYCVAGALVFGAVLARLQPRKLVNRADRTAGLHGTPPMRPDP
ncbi:MULTISPECIES: hypothetical protein [unclassified Caballeronia]|uniref:hypothetical protein n=1 Tax=unclassified Caballeronia TaxID=2646786 RepID=UPI002863889C|nr:MULTISPECIES: hypothetical protein [unclassified Caballeronia]MDR5753807.1 hypothetical protein [Caballeronia sp. LZ024]MDR5840186.1 hypothetical protein [Caballeronia sp. LZ031]